MEHKGSLPCSQEPTTSPYLEPDQSTPQPPTDLFNTHLSLGVHICLFPLGFPPKTYMHLSSLPYVPYVPPTSFFSILPSGGVQIMEALHYTVSPTTLLTKSVLGPNRLQQPLLQHSRYVGSHFRSSSATLLYDCKIYFLLRVRASAILLQTTVDRT
jgi:hypothetical protein